MLMFLKYLIQLMLSPTQGWADVAKNSPEPAHLLNRGLYPLMIVSALTELLAIVYDHDTGWLQVITASIADFGAYFLAIYISRLVLDICLPKLCVDTPDYDRAQVFITCSVGLMVLFQIIDNVLPWSLMIIKFLPLYAVLVLSKASKYMQIRKNEEMRFLGIAATTTIAMPYVIYYLIYLLIK